MLLSETILNCAYDQFLKENGYADSCPPVSGSFLAARERNLRGERESRPRPSRNFASWAAALGDSDSPGQAQSPAPSHLAYSVHYHQISRSEKVLVNFSESSDSDK